MSALAGLLDERGFERLVSIRAGDHFTRKINAIKEVRGLSGVGLREAKDAVEQGLTVLDEVPIPVAQWAVARLEAVGGSGVIEHALAHRYGFSPDHELRGAQICERITVIGPQHELVHERGQLGEFELVERSQPESLEALREAIDELRARWAAAGLVEARSELELIERVSAHNPELERRLEAAADQALASEAAIYNDWLLAHGDPRGLVGAALLARDAAPDHEQLLIHARELGRLLGIYGPHLYGSAGRRFDHGRMTRLGPLVTTLHVDEYAAPGVRPEQLLGLPSFAGLRSLALSRIQPPLRLGALLAESPCVASLRELVVRDTPQLRLGDVELPRVERLELGVRELVLDDCAAPALRRFSLALDFPPADLVATLAGLDAPALETFEFATETHDYWDQHHGPLGTVLGELLHEPSFARLRRLKLRSLGDSMPFHHDLGDALRRLSASRTLEQIDLREAKLTPELHTILSAQQPRFPVYLLPDP